MVDALMGRKIGMTQVFGDTGEAIPVTVLEVGPNYVTQIKTVETDGYSAVQLGFGETRKLSKAERGHLSRVGASGLRHLHEVSGASEDLELGQQLGADVFQKGEKVDLQKVESRRVRRRADGPGAPRLPAGSCLLSTFFCRSTFYAHAASRRRGLARRTG